MTIKSQFKTFTKNYIEHDKPCKITVKIRYDDECNNGHNTFSITAHGFRQASNGKWVDTFCGCCHDEIKKHFPEFAHLIKWHLCGEFEPMYYLENTLYLASNCESTGHKSGYVKRVGLRLKFDNFPVVFKFSKEFLTALNASKSFKKDLELVKIEHKKESSGYEYSPKFTLNCYPCEWYQCPFDDLQEAEQFLTALHTLKWEVVEIPVDWYKEKERDFEGARSCAIWPEASEEVLSLPSEQLKAKLLKRLPALMRRFKKDMRALGFVDTVE